VNIIFFCLLFFGIPAWGNAETPWFSGSDYPPLPSSKNSGSVGDYPPPRTPATPPPLYPNYTPPNSVLPATSTLTPVFPGLPGYDGALPLPALTTPTASPSTAAQPAAAIEPSSLDRTAVLPPSGSLLEQTLPTLSTNPLLSSPAAGSSYRLPALPLTSAPADFASPSMNLSAGESTLQGQLDGNWASNAGDQLWIQGNFFQLVSQPRTLDSAIATGWQPRWLRGEVRYLPQNRLLIRSQGVELQYQIYLDGQSFIAEDPNGVRLRFERVFLNQ
jgi:hypothetical protein